MSVPSRRTMLKGSAAGAAALAFLGVPLGFAVAVERALAQGGPSPGTGPGAALQRALKLEYLAAAFYTAGYDRYRNVGGTVENAAERFTPGEDAVVATIAAHEAAHVSLLRGVLGATAPAPAAYDFSGGGGAGNGPFVHAVGTAATASKADFFKLAQLLEDFTVRAYLGQIGGLVGTSAASTAVRLLTTEAHHAALVRTLRTPAITLGAAVGYSGTVGVDASSDPMTITPWPAYATATAGLYDAGYSGQAGGSGTSQADLAALVYGPATPEADGVQAPSAGEDNLVQTSSEGSTTVDAPAGAEAFDEPMAAAAVAAVAAFFGAA